MENNEVWLVFKQTSDQYGTEEVVHVCGDEPSALLEESKIQDSRSRIQKFKVGDSLPDWDLLYKAFKQGNECSFEPEDDPRTIEMDFRKWYVKITKDYKTK